MSKDTRAYESGQLITTRCQIVMKEFRYFRRLKNVWNRSGRPIHKKTLAEAATQIISARVCVWKFNCCLVSAFSRQGRGFVSLANCFPFNKPSFLNSHFARYENKFTGLIGRGRNGAYRSKVLQCTFSKRPIFHSNYGQA